MREVKKDFPIFENRPGLIYLDSAATSQKPKTVIKAVTNFMEKYNANVHRGIYTLSQEATEKYEQSRKKIGSFVGTADSGEIIFTGNASEAINLVAVGYAKKYLTRGDVVAVSEMEHHSNLVPWMRLREEAGIEIVYMPVKKDFTLDYEAVVKNGTDKKRIKMVAVTQASNVLGTINPIKKMVAFLKRNDIHAKVLVDGAQSVPHMPVDVKDLGCDFLVFSGHKMLGPTGVGVLWGKRELLEEMDPVMTGSHMIGRVSRDKVIYADIPDRFEVGTGRLEAVVGLGEAADYINKLGREKILEEEKKLTKFLQQILYKIDGITWYGSRDYENRLGVFSFNVDGVHAHDVAEILNRKQICVRAGHHCAQPLLDTLGQTSTVRASVYIYNKRADIEALAEGLSEVKKIFKK